MLTITDGASLARALSSFIDERIKQLLIKRCNQLGDITDQARFVIAQSGDTLHQLERQLGFSVFQNAGDGSRWGEAEFAPGWEWIEDHGFAYELVFIFDDGGFAYVVIVENCPGVDSKLLELCATYASEHA